jgi:hypothetical protein
VICLLERCKLVSSVQRYVQCPECQEWHALGKAEDASDSPAQTMSCCSRSRATRPNQIPS